MLDNVFKGLFDKSTVRVIPVSQFLICVISALVLGVLIAAAYTYKARYSKSFFITLSLLPAVVCVIIMMVNGNIGAGVAVAGAFGLVRFRSAPGTAKEIGSLFMATGAGLILGMGYIAYAFLFAIIMSAANMAMSAVCFKDGRQESIYKTIRITIPEDLDYDGIFDGIFDEYTDKYELTLVKTTNMGSLFRLTYDLTMKKDANEKDMINKLRLRNGNLEITVSKQEASESDL